MSISSIANNHTIPSTFSVGAPNANQTAALGHLRQQFQQLGKDLQSGKLAAAQTDFSALQLASSASTKSAPGHDPVTQALNQLVTDLRSGNLAGPPLKPAPGAPIAQPGPQTPGVPRAPSPSFSDGGTRRPNLAGVWAGVGPAGPRPPVQQPFSGTASL